ncbi:MAG: phosphatase PAP2 family protein [Deltaproteobacteria bacterium]|nr:phosphatase PAP2 family protein [Deltaproteobacteria bacterium]
MTRGIAALLILSILFFPLPAFTEESKPSLEPETAPEDFFENHSRRAEKFFFKEMPRHIGNDFKYTFWSSTGAVLVGSLGASAAFHPLDDDLNRKLNANEIFGKTFNDVSGWVLSPYSQFGVSLITWGIAKKLDKPKLAMTMESTLEALAITEVLTLGAKLATQRTRPNGERFSLPSNHTSSIFATATVLTSAYGWKVAIPAYSLATLSALTRIDSKKHWLTDVLAGASLGIAVGWGTTKFHKKEHPDIFLTPQVTSHGAAIQFTKIY